MPQTPRQSEATEGPATLSIELWNNIAGPGAYVFLETGELARMPICT